VISFKSFLLQEEIIDDDVDEMIHRIKTECAPFLKEIDFKVNPSIENARFINDTNVPRALWRSSENDAPLVKLSGNRVRHPTDTSPEMHALFVKHFSHQFGYPYRAMGVFCSTSRQQAAGYPGNLFLIFPIGEYEYIYAPDVDDAYSQFDNHLVDMPGAWHEILRDMGEDEEDYLTDTGDVNYDAWYQLVYEYLGKNTPYTNANLKSALSMHSERGIEVVLKCDNYYALCVDPKCLDTAVAVLTGLTK
jgi:hypothetical protein